MRRFDVVSLHDGAVQQLEKGRPWADPHTDGRYAVRKSGRARTGTVSLVDNDVGTFLGDDRFDACQQCLVFDVSEEFESEAPLLIRRKVAQVRMTPRYLGLGVIESPVGVSLHRPDWKPSEQGTTGSERHVVAGIATRLGQRGQREDVPEVRKRTEQNSHDWNLRPRGPASRATEARL